MIWTDDLSRNYGEMMSEGLDLTVEVSLLLLQVET